MEVLLYSNTGCIEFEGYVVEGKVLRTILICQGTDRTLSTASRYVLVPYRTLLTVDGACTVMRLTVMFQNSDSDGRAINVAAFFKQASKHGDSAPGPLFLFERLSTVC